MAERSAHHAFSGDSCELYCLLFRGLVRCNEHQVSASLLTRMFRRFGPSGYVRLSSTLRGPRPVTWTPERLPTPAVAAAAAMSVAQDVLSSLSFSGTPVTRACPG